MIAILDQHRDEIAELCRKYRVQRLESFGSAARGDFDPNRSDLDFLVEFDDEALSQLRKIDPVTAEGITDWQAIIGFRNMLIHGYGQVDHAKTWDYSSR